MLLPWPDRYSSTALRFTSSLYCRFAQFPFSASADKPSARYLLTQLSIVEWPTPARRAASQICSRPERYSSTNDTFLPSWVLSAFPFGLPPILFRVRLIKSIPNYPEVRKPTRARKWVPVLRLRLNPLGRQNWARPLLPKKRQSCVGDQAAAHAGDATPPGVRRDKDVGAPLVPRVSGTPLQGAGR